MCPIPSPPGIHQKTPFPGPSEILFELEDLYNKYTFNNRCNSRAGGESNKEDWAQWRSFPTGPFLCQRLHIWKCKITFLQWNF